MSHYIELRKRILLTEDAKESIASGAKVLAEKFAAYLECDCDRVQLGPIKFDVSAEGVKGTLDLVVQVNPFPDAAGPYHEVLIPNFALVVKSGNGLEISNASHSRTPFRLDGELDSLFRECFNDAAKHYLNLPV